MNAENNQVRGSDRPSWVPYLLNVFFASVGFISLRFLLAPVRIKILTYLLTKEQYGTITLIGLTVSFVALVSSLGSLEFLLRRLPGREESYQQGILKTVVVYFGGLSIVLAILGAVALAVWSPSKLALRPADAVACGLLLVLTIHLTQRGFYLLGRAAYSRARIAQLLYVDAWFVPFALLALLSHPTTSAALWVWTAWMALTVVVTHGWVKPAEVRAAQATPALLKEILLFGIPLLPMILGDMLIRMQDRYVLLGLKDLAAVANYALCINIAMIGTQVGGSVLDILLTEFFRLRNQIPGNSVGELAAHEGLRTGFTAMVRYSLIISIAVGAAMAFAGPQIIRFISNSRFMDAAGTLPWAAPFPAMYLLCVIFGRALIAVGRSGITGWATLAAAGVNVVLNLLLVPSLGERGAAFAAWVSLALLAVYLGWRARCWKWIQWEQLRLSRLLVLLVIQSAGFWLAARWLGSKAWLALLAGGVWCLACILVLRVVRKEDLQLVVPSLRRPESAAPAGAEEEVIS